MQLFLHVFLLVFFCTGTSFCETIRTTLGQIKGRTVRVEGNEYRVFLAVPFAEPPVGELRLQDPVPKKPWNPDVVYDADGDFSKACYQFSPDTSKISEDCLYLNIFAPSSNAAKPRNGFPVMFWIHGGAFISGSGELLIDGILKNFVSKDVVVVSINYRLGALGFWNLKSPVVPGNFGIMDQVLALQWTKNNAPNFGGDPDRITIFGESAGSVSVSLLTISPLSKGLFDQAILQSGSVLAPWAINGDWETVDTSKMLADLLGIVSS